MCTSFFLGRRCITFDWVLNIEQDRIGTLLLQEVEDIVTGFLLEN